MPHDRSPQAVALSPRSRWRAPGYVRWGKRSLDLIAVLVLLLPVALLLVPLVALVGTDGGRPIFGHARVGRGGRTFTCWKIRTMVPDAEARLEEVLRTDPKAAAQWAQYRKLDNDPRVTRLGDVLRRTSLDELPQLWNVLCGDMSLVGPRPVTRAELAQYGSASLDYISVRPGITGLWQVQGRNSLTYTERVRLDQQYVQELTCRQDLHILFKTVSVVFARTGS